jgi:hypothetical protein
MKTGSFLKAKVVSNFVKQAFNDAEVEGSGHRLRAIFAEDVGRNAYLKEFAPKGLAWGMDVVLLMAASALGQAIRKPWRLG